MTTALKLIAKVIALEVPPRVVFFGLMNKLNYLLKTGNRRFEFERLYLETVDPWEYHTSPYERGKYEHTLDSILKLRRGEAVALEVGCSLGVFSGMLAEHFDQVVCLDISQEALRQARAHNAARPNLAFFSSDILSFVHELKADVIICAEVLYYIREADADRVVHSLDEHLAADGLIFYVSGIDEGPSNPDYFNGWEAVISQRFRVAHKERVADPVRPYELIVFERSTPG